MHLEALSPLCSHWHRLASARPPGVLVRVSGKVHEGGGGQRGARGEPLLQLRSSQHLEKRMASPFSGEWLTRTRCGYLLAVAASAL